MYAIDAAERFVKLLDAVPPTPARLAEAKRLLKALAAVPWEDTTARTREAGWTLTLRLSLLKYGPGQPASQPPAVERQQP
jgi:hypothetical protein